MKPLLTFVHISDTHLGPTPDYALQGVVTLPRLEQAITLINAFRQPPDFVVHTGDLSTDRSPESYALAAEALARLHVPIYFINGNHDDRALGREVLGVPVHLSGDANAPVDYVFTVKGERFLALDAWSEAVPDPQGHLTEAQLDFVRSEAAPDGPPLTVFLHYPPFLMASPWLDAHMLIDNGEALHQALRPARDRLRGVFYGHLHHSAQVSRGGITYTCAGSTSVPYRWRPWDQVPVVDDAFPPTYNVVQYFRNRVAIHQYTFSLHAPSHGR